MNILYTGKEGGGKSSIINAILEENKANVGNDSTTTDKIEKYSKYYNNLQISFLDSPGILGKYYSDYKDENIIQMMNDIRDQIDVVCIVLDISNNRLSSDVGNVIKFYKNNLSDIPLNIILSKTNLCTSENILKNEGICKGVLNNLLINTIPITHFNTNVPTEFWENLERCTDGKFNIIDNVKIYNSNKPLVKDVVINYLNNQELEVINNKLEASYLAKCYLFVILLCQITLISFSIIAFVCNVYIGYLIYTCISIIFSTSFILVFLILWTLIRRKKYINIHTETFTFNGYYHFNGINVYNIKGYVKYSEEEFIFK